jgi:Tol biopolymer transport system component
MDRTIAALAPVAGASWWRGSLAGTCVFVALAGPAGAAPGDTELVTRHAATHRAVGGTLAWPSGQRSISRDGRYVAFESRAASLSRDERSGGHLYVWDRTTGAHEQLDVDAAGIPDPYTNWSPVLSADGRYVAFETNSPTLVPGLNPGYEFIVALRDRQTGTTEAVSLNRDGTRARPARHPSISEDGRYVVFSSDAVDLASDGSPGGGVFLRDRTAGTTSRLDACGGMGTISADGRVAVYETCAGLVARILATGAIEPVSVGNDGSQLHGREPHVSGDGRYVVFTSDVGAPLVQGVRASRVHLRDRLTARTEIVSRDVDGAPVAGAATLGSVSDDGRYVAFQTWARDVVRDAYAGGVFVHDRVARTTVRASVDSHGGGTRIAPRGGISGDGRYVAFDTDTPLVPEDGASTEAQYFHYDVYVHELGEVRTPTFRYWVMPQALDFGERALGTRSSLSFWLKNTGTSSLPIRTLRIAGRDHAVFSRSRHCDFVFPGQSCRIRVTLNATATTPGPKQAELQVVGGIDTAATRPVTATVVEPGG